MPSKKTKYSVVIDDDQLHTLKDVIKDISGLIILLSCEKRPSDSAVRFKLRSCENNLVKVLSDLDLLT